MKFLLSLSLLFSLCFGQEVKINRLNTYGCKQGYWIDYCDENMKQVDSINFKYKRFQYYDNGKPLINYKKFYSRTNCTFIKSGNYKENSRLLDGYVIEVSYGDTLSKSSYNSGYPLEFSYYGLLYKIKDTAYMEKVFFPRLTDTSRIAYTYEYWTNGIGNLMFLNKKCSYIKSAKGKWTLKCIRK